MDYYRSESEFIDSLDFLSPPVKRVINSRGLLGPSYSGEPDSIQLFRGFRGKCTSKERGIENKQEKERHRKASKYLKTGGESSTSLILKKTSEGKILKRYTVLSYTSLHSCLNKTTSRRVSNRLECESKPLIKVTVIPKTDQLQTAKLLRKRRNIPKRVQSTLSDTENSLKTKNLYLVVAGRRDKIYEIKTTGSATFTPGQAERYIYSKDDISIEGLSNVKHLIQSLDMDKKQKKLRKEHSIDEKKKSYLATNRHDAYYHESNGNDPYETQGYTNSGNVESGKRHLNRSRVRIYGQLGITDDDRYVLRYGATVNDKPVTDFAQLTQDFLPQVLPEAGYSPYEANPEVTKEVSVQATHGGYYRNQQPTASSFDFRKESQGTQVNFNVTAIPRKQYNNPRVDKNVQCTCSTSEIKDEKNPLKEAHSPLVIISVYPRQSPEEVIMHNSDRYSKIPNINARAQNMPKLKVEKITNKKTMEPKVDSKEKKIIQIKTNNRLSPGNRSPSPVQYNISKRTSPENKKETIVLKTPTNSSPERYKAMRAINNKTLEKEKGKPQSPATSKFRVPAQRSKSPLKKKNTIRSQEKGTNTDHAKAKKEIVDNYTKQLTCRMNNTDKIPARRNNSKATINIEGEQEFYNVLLDQSKLSTDLRVNRKMKNIGSQKGCHRNTSPSLENLLLPNKEPNVQGVSVPFCDKQFDASSINNRRVSGMTIRDSLEISHRREDKHYLDVPNTQTRIPAKPINKFKKTRELLAPTKHYTGDDCSIFDPVERDKQIRELLGVNKSKCFVPSSLQALSSGNEEYPLHCFYRRECEKRQLAEINLVKFCPILGSISKVTRRTNCPRPCCRNAVCNIGNTYLDDEEFNDEITMNASEQGRNRETTISTHSKQQSVSENNQELAGNTENSAVYQQLILNRNIQVFLQVEQFSKQKPIILSRKQYDKVKKTIQTTLSKKTKEKIKKFKERLSDITVGQVRQRRNKELTLQCNQQIQTEVLGFRSSYQRTNKRPRLISKVRYLARPSASKLIRERFPENYTNAYSELHQGIGDLCEYYEDYPQEATKDDIGLYPRNYEYYRPSAEYCEIKRQKQYEQASGSRRNAKCIKLNDQRDIHRNYITDLPSVIARQNDCNNCKNYNTLNDNGRLETKQHHKENNQCRQDCKDCFNTKEIECLKVGDHHIVIDKYGKEYEERRKPDEDNLKHKVEQPTYNKEYCKESRQYCTVITKYCIDCGKLYKPNKECCKLTREQRKPNDITFRDTKRCTPYENCSKKHTGHIKGFKKCVKESGNPYVIGINTVRANDHPTNDVCHRKSGLFDFDSKDHVTRSRSHDIACGEYNLKSEGSQLISLQQPPNRGKYQEDLPQDIAVHDNIHHNKEIHKIDKNTGGNSAKKWEHYTPINAPEDVVLEHTKPFDERNKPHIECAPSIKYYEKSLREHPKYNAMTDKNLTATVSPFVEEIYEKRNRVPEQEPHVVYSGQSCRSLDYFNRDAATDYFGQSVEYCRLDVNYHRHTKKLENIDRYIAAAKELLAENEQCDRETENEEQLRRVTLYDAENKQDNLEIDNTDNSKNKTISSLEIYCTSVSYLKKLDSANSDVAVRSDTSLCHVNSIQTIFRGHRKSPTPNLGTSMYSLYSEDEMTSNKSTRFIMAPRDVKPNKRPFLRRLMSCLVMRSTKPSVLKLPITPAQEVTSVNSSVDSYHISTSLGAVEVSSSIYDTSASFYSNHTILPINSKIKRGFFNSVRGFLTNRRS